MMNNLDIVLQQLHADVVSVRRCAPDLRSDMTVELLDDQKTIRTGVIYLASCHQLEAQLEKVYIQPGAYLMVSDVTQAGQITRLSLCERITVIEFSCRLKTLYNRLTRVMDNHFRKVIIENSEFRPRQEKLPEIWQQIRSRTLQGHVEVREQLRQICPNIKPYVRLVMIVSEDGCIRSDWAEPLQQLQNAMPESYLFVSQESTGTQIVGFQFFDRQNFGIIDRREAIDTILSECKLNMMVSNATRDYGKLNTLYRLTRRAGLIGEQLNLQQGNRIYDYERYGMYQVIDLCTQRYMSLFNHSDIVYLVHPIVVHLTRYDERHRTNLRDVLFYYLQNSRDLKRTAEMLYMHRNTVANKLNQIRSICHIDFEDGGLCQRLLFSCQVMLYYEKVLQQRIGRNELSREE